ncbi:MAG TPA: hypothetical protein HA252_06215 [Candidatus Diapherotrites archaeon]|uniref:Uncharacterized protein n=1 Tax=Candidatus Iainarchaeum sp. TaxID=3101447 RepID=A0A7J4JGW4_9ARCH|nr:hypothetical protein [Candidatus Diapherotrites archaeon]HIH16972.1 hypothetical protein [Candidatus Diapherotrites archaeon]
MKTNLAQLAITALLLLSIASMASAREFVQTDKDIWGGFWAVVNEKPYCRIYQWVFKPYMEGTLASTSMKAFGEENAIRYRGIESCFAGLKGNVTTAEVVRTEPTFEGERNAEEPAAKNYETAPNREARMQEVKARYYGRRNEAGARVAIRRGEIKGEFIAPNFNSLDDVSNYRDQIINGTYAARPWVRYYAQSCNKYPLEAMVEVAKTGTTSYMSVTDTQRSIHEFTTCFKELIDDVLAATGQTQLVITRGVTSGVKGEVSIPVSVAAKATNYPPACTKKYMMRWIDHCVGTGQCPTGMKQACGL